MIKLIIAIILMNISSILFGISTLLGFGFFPKLFKFPEVRFKVRLHTAIIGMLLMLVSLLMLD